MLPTEMKSTPVSAIVANRLESNAAGGLELDRLGGWRLMRHRLAHGRQARNHPACAISAPAAIAWLQFVQILDLDLHRNRSPPAFGRRHRQGDRTGRHDVIFLDEDSVEQPHAMIVAAADAHRVFLRRAQSRNGLAGVEQAAMRAFEELAKACAAVAVPHSSCRKLSAVRSPVSSARAGPSTREQNLIRRLAAAPFGPPSNAPAGSTAAKQASRRVCRK
jgi:hypothetical protein